MTELTAKRCIPCEGGVAPMDADEAAAMLGQLDDWRLDEAGKEISRGFTFKNFHVFRLIWIKTFLVKHRSLLLSLLRLW